VTLIAAGKPVDILWIEPGFGPGGAPDLSGIPVLFPFGGRLKGTSFRWQGIEYEVTSGIINGGTAIHGFVLNRPWRVVSRSDDSVTGEFHASVDDPDLLGQWPSDFRIRMRYEIRARSLACAITIDNPDTRPMPYGFATHGYYRTPLNGGDGEACEVTIPADLTWVLDSQAIPTGDIQPVDESNDLRAGSAINGRQFNTVYTDVAEDKEGRVVCAVRDPAAGRRIEIASSGGFREVVVWNPPNREAIAIEPYTCCPTTFDLEERGFDAGLRVLEPGQADDLRMVITLVDDQSARTNLRHYARSTRAFGLVRS
jgi:aldose 1-epimerase